MIGFGWPVVPEDITMRQGSVSAIATTGWDGGSAEVNQSSVAATTLRSAADTNGLSTITTEIPGTSAIIFRLVTGAETRPSSASARLTAMCRLGTAIQTPTTVPAARPSAAIRAEEERTAASIMP